MASCLLHAVSAQNFPVVEALLTFPLAPFSFPCPPLPPPAVADADPQRLFNCFAEAPVHPLDSHGRAQRTLLAYHPPPTQKLRHFWGLRGRTRHLTAAGDGVCLHELLCAAVPWMKNAAAGGAAGAARGRTRLSQEMQSAVDEQASVLPNVFNCNAVPSSAARAAPAAHRRRGVYAQATRPPLLFTAADQLADRCAELTTRLLHPRGPPLSRSARRMLEDERVLDGEASPTSDTATAPPPWRAVAAMHIIDALLEEAPAELPWSPAHSARRAGAPAVANLAGTAREGTVAAMACGCSECKESARAETEAAGGDSGTGRGTCRHDVGGSDDKASDASARSGPSAAGDAEHAASQLRSEAPPCACQGGLSRGESSAEEYACKPGWHSATTAAAAAEAAAAEEAATDGEYECGVPVAVLRPVPQAAAAAAAAAADDGTGMPQVRWDAVLLEVALGSALFTEQLVCFACSACCAARSEQCLP